MSERGLLIVLSGPSGAGKGTVLGKAFKKETNLYYSVSVTTRKPRHGEKEGVNYFFRTKSQFDKMLADGEFLESMEVYGNFYGTPKSNVERMLSEGKDVVLEIDVKGAMEVKSKCDEAIMVFLTPSNAEEIKHRLMMRNTETEQQLNVRMTAIMAEIKRINEYDYVIFNDDADTCAKEFLAILRAEKRKVARNINLLTKLTEVN